MRTNKDGWDKCSTKQVNADRLELFILDKLTRIHDDTKYLEYLVFNTNHAIETGSHPRIELLHTEILYSPEIVKNILFCLLNGLERKKGIEYD